MESKLENITLKNQSTINCNLQHKDHKQNNVSLIIHKKLDKQFKQIIIIDDDDQQDTNIGQIQSNKDTQTKQVTNHEQSLENKNNSETQNILTEQDQKPLKDEKLTLQKNIEYSQNQSEEQVQNKLNQMKTLENDLINKQIQNQSLIKDQQNQNIQNESDTKSKQLEECSNVQNISKSQNNIQLQLYNVNKNNIQLASIPCNNNCLVKNFFGSYIEMDEEEKLWKDQYYRRVYNKTREEFMQDRIKLKEYKNLKKLQFLKQLQKQSQEEQDEEIEQKNSIIPRPSKIFKNDLSRYSLRNTQSNSIKLLNKKQSVKQEQESDEEEFVYNCRKKSTDKKNEKISIKIVLKK